MTNKLILTLICLVDITCYGQVFPVIVTNTNQGGGTPLSINTSSNGSSITTFDVNRKLAASLVTSGATVNGSDGSSTNSWYKVDLPHHDTSPQFGYCAAGSTFTNPECSGSVLTVSNSSYPILNLRTGPATTFSLVTIGSDTAQISLNQKFVHIATQTETSGGFTNTWYKIHLVNSCSADEGWVAGVFNGITRCTLSSPSATALPTPTGLSVSNLQNTSATLSWDMTYYPSGTIDCGFQIYNSANSLLATDSNSDLNESYTLTSLTAGTNYTVYSKGIYGSCISDNSNPLTFTTAGGSCMPPPAPPNPTSNSPQCNTVVITRSGIPTGSIVWYWQGTSCGTSTNLGSGATFSATASGIYYLRAYDVSVNCWSTGCGSVNVTVNTTSVAPSSIIANPPSIAPSESCTLSPIGGSIGTGASWKWYSGSCGGTLIGTGNQIDVSPNATTTYWVRAEGGTCNVTTSCASVTVAVGSSAPAVISITFTNAMEDFPLFTSPHTLFSGSPTNVGEPIKICSDGSSSTYVKVNVSNTSGISFRILDENGNVQSDISKYGLFGTPYTFGNNVEAIFTHPEYMELDWLFRECTLQVLHNGTPISGIGFPIHFYRAPLLFVHGWMGDASTFELMEGVFFDHNYVPQITRRMQYNNTASFEDNISVVHDGLLWLFLETRANDFSCGKADVVAHSMGGCVARLYLQSDNYYEDIHKLITLNTPHSGTPGANFIYDFSESSCGVLNWINFGNGFLCSPAVESMMVDNAGINLLNGTTNINGTAHDHVVPSFAIVTQDELVLDWDCFSLGLLLYNPGLDVLDFLGNDVFDDSDIDEIFDFEEHDVIVPVSSQGGGLNKQYIFNGQCHMDSYEDDGVIDFVNNLLSLNPTSTYFDIDGFSPVNLNYTPPPLIPNSHEGISISGEVVITSPEYGITYDANTPIQIETEGSPSIAYTVIVAGNSHLSLFASDTLASNSSTIYTIPPEAIGALRFACLAYDSLSNLLDIDTLQINVDVTAQIDSIGVYPDLLNVSIGSNAVFQIIGYYSDGIVRDLSEVENVLLVVDNVTIAQYIDPNTITGLIEGNTSITVTYDSIQTIVPIYVYQDEEITTTIFSSDSQIACAGTTIDFQDLSIGSVESRQWYFEGGEPSMSSEQNPHVIYPISGVFDVSLIETFSSKTDTLIIPNYVTVVGSASPLITVELPACSESYFPLSCSDNFISYQWNTGENASEISVQAEGIYSVNTIDEYGCSGQDDFSLTRPPEFIWVKLFGGEGLDQIEDISTDNSGNILTIGRVKSLIFSLDTDSIVLNGLENAIILKLNAQGGIVWYRVIESEVRIIDNHITTDESGNVYVSGRFKGSFISFDGITVTSNNPNDDIYIAKYSSDGIILWAKSFGGFGSEYVDGMEIDHDNNLLLTGHYLSLDDSGFAFDEYQMPPNNIGAYVTKFNSLGQVIWAKNIGGALETRPSDLAVDIDNNIVITGIFEGAIYSLDGFEVFNNGPWSTNDAFVLSLNSFGSSNWIASLGGSQNDAGDSVCIDGQNNINVQGEFGSDDFGPSETPLTRIGSTDVFICQLNNQGNLNWTTSLGSAAWDYSSRIAVDPIGNVYSAFSSSNSFFAIQNSNYETLNIDEISIIKLTALGSEVWIKSVGGIDHDYASSLICTGVDQCIIAGYTRSPLLNLCNNILNTSGNYDFFI